VISPFSFSRLESLSEGHFFGRKETWVEPDSVCIDSREGAPARLFVPLKGERTDGHSHIEGALERGCSAVLVDRVWAGKHVESLNGWIGRYNVLFFPVDDTLKKMQYLAEKHRKQFSEMTVIGVTGSNGKTTTKEMIHSILSCHKPTYKNQGNLNSEIGLPLTVLRMDRKYDYAVLEMGINHIGEMDVLVQIARPELAVVTNIGQAHIGYLGNQRRIAEEKRKIFSLFGPENTAFIYENEGFADILTEHLRGTVRYYGEKALGGLLEVRDRGMEGQDLVFTDGTVSLALPGRHNLINALAAVSVARHLEIPWECIRQGLSGMAASFGRTEILKGRVDVIQDCYNANPDSVAAAVRMLETMPAEGRRILVLGDMLELGEESSSAHAALGQALADSPVRRIFLFGPEMAAAADALRSRRPDVFHTTDFEQLRFALNDFVREGDLVLLKGSRGMELERLTDGLAGSGNDP